MDENLPPSSKSMPLLPTSGHEHLHNENDSNWGLLNDVESTPLPGAPSSLELGSSQGQTQLWHLDPLTNEYDLGPSREAIDSIPMDPFLWHEDGMPATSSMSSFTTTLGANALEGNLFANEAQDAAVFADESEDTAPNEAPRLISNQVTGKLGAGTPVENSGIPLTGQRGLPRRKSRYSRNTGGRRAVPTDIPGSTSSQRSVDPMQRWRDSPPEDEPASLSAIFDAVQNTPARGGLRSNVGPRRSLRRAVSNPSSAGSNSSTSASSAVSAASSQLPFTLTSRPSGRVTKAKRSEARPNHARPFHCTFCCDRFKTKYDWTRHEKSLHLSMESWVCAPEGGISISLLTGARQCVYCSLPSPSLEHLETHNHSVCQNNTPESRVFRRKDNLIQHLRHVHDIGSVPPIDHWKINGPSITSRCGFCDLRMSSWKERQDHLAGHFKRGSTMADWKGDHGFEPSVACLVTNSLPPYLIGSESKSLVPFSATSQETKDHYDQIQSRASLVSGQTDSQSPLEATGPAKPKAPMLHDLPETLSTQGFAEILTRHLGIYARQQMALGIIPTDDMFQQESRRLLYDSEDTWNQTVADNAEWLGNFRANHYHEESTKPGPKR